MNIEQCKNFLAIIKYGSFSSAAEELSLSQSCLSKHILALESELNLQLFNRSKRVVQLTNAGCIFEKHAKHFVLTHQKMLAELQEYNRTEKGLIRIATIPIIAQYDIARVISKFQEKNPDIKILFEESENAKIIPALQQDQYNFAILRTNHIDHKAYHIWPVAQDTLTLVTSMTHPLADKKTVSIQELKDEKFILMDKGSGIYDICMKAFSIAGFEPNISFMSTHIENVIGLVASGQGITMSMRKVIDYFKNPNLSIIPITENIESITALVKPVQQVLNPSEKLFVKFIDEYVALQHL